MSSTTAAPETAAPPAVVLDVAATHLRALGHRPERLPGGALALGTGPHRIEGRISWAGPVALPLHGEADVRAACGLMQVHGRRNGRPVALGVDFGSVAAGVLAATGLLAALRAGPAGGTARGRLSVGRAGGPGRRAPHRRP
ncbi:hypothetical protein [Kitasatospora sp. NPDC085879]|uniref:hypothetical protein n=1 Tax=Kitasatospora sp. NPDC085879 TaxID=3154769 RepID=UPI00341E3285